MYNEVAEEKDEKFIKVLVSLARALLANQRNFDFIWLAIGSH